MSEARREVCVTGRLCTDIVADGIVGVAVFELEPVNLEFLSPSLHLTIFTTIDKSVIFSRGLCEPVEELENLIAELARWAFLVTPTPD
jgi:hypothetical protein